MNLPDRRELKRLANQAKAEVEALEPIVEKEKCAMDEAEAAFAAAQSRYHAANGRLNRTRDEMQVFRTLNTILKWPDERRYDLFVVYSGLKAPAWAMKAKAATQYLGSPAWKNEFATARRWIIRWQQENP